MASLMTKKEFKKKIKSEKTKTYKLKSISTILACIGFAIVAVTYYIAVQCNFSNMNTLIGFVVGVPFAIVGAVLDIISDLKINKDYKEYKKRQSNLE